MREKTALKKGRPKNPDGTAPLSISVVPRVRGWLEEIADYAVFGKTATAVAERFILDGVYRQLKADGLLKSPPPKPRRKP